MGTKKPTVAIETIIKTMKNHQQLRHPIVTFKSKSHLFPFFSSVSQSKHTGKYQKNQLKTAKTCDFLRTLLVVLSQLQEIKEEKEEVQRLLERSQKPPQKWGHPAGLVSGVVLLFWFQTVFDGLFKSCLNCCLMHVF